jgi:hypothetical protein
MTESEIEASWELTGSGRINPIICNHMKPRNKYNQSCKEKFGAGEGIRTLDPNLGKVVLYH